MKYLEDLRGKHKGEEIWVIGAGSSLDKFPLTFFSDKICIGVNWVFSVFLDIGDGIEKFATRAFYSVHSHAEHAFWIRDNRPEHLKNCIFILHSLSTRKSKGWQYCCAEDFNEDPSWIRNSAGARVVRATDADFMATVKCIIAGRNDCRYFCRGTTLHWAIEVAAVLGAKKICVAGSDAQGYHMRKHGSLYAADKRKYNSPQWRAGTKALAAAFKPYGIEILYGKGV